jgi:hypothetical protein
MQIRNGTVVSCLVRVNPTHQHTKLILIHELGHCFGINHSTADGSIMNAVISGSHAVVADDALAIRTLYPLPHQATIAGLAR